MMEEDWNDTFYDLFREAVGRYHEGHRNVDGFFTDQEIIFLSSDLWRGGGRAESGKAETGAH